MRFSLLFETRVSFVNDGKGGGDAARGATRRRREEAAGARGREGAHLGAFRPRSDGDAFARRLRAFASPAVIVLRVVLRVDDGYRTPPRD
jgi:hypothetical protein